MPDNSIELLSAVYEIRELLRLMAEPAIASRDKLLRDELRRIVGKSPQKASSVRLMDGNRTQGDIRAKSMMTSGNLSTLVKQLANSKLVLGDPKRPKLALPIPPNFFDELEGK